jgi:hypothetical protein
VHRASLTVLGGLLIAFSVGRPLGAQDRSIVELGGSVVRFPVDSVGTAGPYAHWTGTREHRDYVATASAGAIAGPGGASGIADLSAKRLAPLAAGWRGELGGELGGLFSTGARSSSYSMAAIASGRLLRPVAAGGLWLRGSTSLARRSPDQLPGGGIGAGAWWRWPGLQIVATLAREWNVAQLFTGPGRAGYAGTVPLAYTEAALGVEVERDQATFSLSGAVRRDPGAEHLVERAVSAAAVLWRTPTRAIVLSVASQLPDFVRGADAARSVSIGLRLNQPTPMAERALRTRPTIQVSGDSAARTVRVRAPGARTVEIMGDFTDWAPLTLAPAGDVFSVTLPVAAGARRVVVRVDGGPWRPAANTPAVDDDFGGRVGLLLVP